MCVGALLLQSACLVFGDRFVGQHLRLAWGDVVVSLLTEQGLELGGLLRSFSPQTIIG